MTGQGNPDEVVSIHASAWEATAAAECDRLKAEFQSTPPHGRRRDRH